VLNAIAYQAEELAGNAVIEELASLRYLPRYGFPIGLQALRTAGGAFPREGKGSVKLERDGMTALGEYVPGSQLLAGGRIFSSRGIARSFDKDESRTFGITWYRFDCTAGHSFYKTQSSRDSCIEGCTAVLKSTLGRPLIIPRFGYECAAWDPPSWRGAVERVGSTETVSAAFVDQPGLHPIPNFGGIKGLSATFCEDGMLIGVNAGGPQALGFAICTRCGYSDRERAKGKLAEKLPPGFAMHTPLWKRKAGSLCWTTKKADVLRNQALGAQVNTDLLQLNLSEIVRAQELHLASLTLAHSLRIAAAALLGVDERDFAVLAVRLGAQAFAGAQIYETTPGGNGHLAVLLAQQERWMQDALGLLRGTEDHHERCREACLRCVLNQHSQNDYERGYLQRQKTLALLSGSGGTLATAEVPSAPTASVQFSVEQRAERLKAKPFSSRK
jgi:DEAD/DEAH box helicase domain-containing protein